MLAVGSITAFIAFNDSELQGITLEKDKDRTNIIKLYVIIFSHDSWRPSVLNLEFKFANNVLKKQSDN
jgi:hypothetical protein